MGPKRQHPQDAEHRVCRRANANAGQGRQPSAGNPAAHESHRHRTFTAFFERAFRTRGVNVSVAVAAFDEAASIGALLDALLRQRCEPDAVMELIVYDDGSRDATREIVLVRGRDDSRIRVIEGGVRRGRAHASNAIFAAARGDAIVKFDADVLPDDGAVRALCAPLERRSWMSFGACDPVCKRSTAVARGAAFAARLVQDLQQRARAPEFTVGRLYGLRREAAARLAIP